MKTLTLFIALFTSALTFGQEENPKDTKGVFFRLNPITSMTHSKYIYTTTYRNQTTGEIHTDEQIYNGLEPSIGLEFGTGYTFNKYVNAGIFLKGVRAYDDITPALFAGLMVEYTPHSLIGVYTRGGVMHYIGGEGTPTYGAGLNLNIPLQSESFTMGFRAGVDYYKMKYEYNFYNYSEKYEYQNYSIDLGINLKWQL